jgi:CrcB protein
MARLCGEEFPWGTLCVNVVGSFLLGAILGAGVVPSEGAVAFERLHAFAAVGFCGGLTTFSTFSLQNLSLLSARGRGALALNVLASVGLCLLVALAGYALLERWTA